MAATTSSDVDYVSAPKDYADLFEKYYAYTVNLCAFFGIDENNKEDVASEILLRFMERGSLEKFDPGLAFEYKDVIHPARFRSYLSRAVDMYVRGHRDRLWRLARREIQIFDIDFSPAGREGIAIVGADCWGEMFAPPHEDHADGIHEMIDEEAEASGVRKLLARVKPRSTHDRCDLVALFDAVRSQVQQLGEYDIKLLKDQFGVSSTAMHTWLWWLKENLADIYGIPLPAKRPRKLHRNIDDDGCCTDCGNVYPCITLREREAARKEQP